MRIGMIGLGRMGANMARRLMRNGHEVVAHDRDAGAVDALAAEGATPAHDLAALVGALPAPRAIWLMVPAGVVDASLASLVPLLEPGDLVVDGGNSFYGDDIRRAAKLEAQGLHYLDAGTSGGVFGLERGYCLMVGGSREAFARLEPILVTLAPGAGSVEPTPGAIHPKALTREDAPDAPAEEEAPGPTAHLGYLHCGPAGAGHFVKMVHNGIEYGMMAAMAEGFGLMAAANDGAEGRPHDAETAPLRHPELYRYELDLPAIAELWRRGSVVSSWLLDLTAAALARDPALAGYQGRVSDSGEGRWTVSAAIDVSVPTHVLAAALFERFASRGESDYADRLLSAMRHQFGGHVEKGAEGDAKPGAAS